MAFWNRSTTVEIYYWFETVPTDAIVERSTTVEIYYWFETYMNPYVVQDIYNSRNLLLVWNTILTNDEILSTTVEIYYWFETCSKRRTKYESTTVEIYYWFETLQSQPI